MDLRTPAGPILASTCPTQPVDLGLTFLTLNAQKAGSKSPFMTDIITAMDRHTPDFLYLTETPLHSHSCALIYTLRNRDYRLHYCPSNASPQQDALPEARLPTHLTHSRVECWLAYNNQIS
jgi:hypothetical protein